VPNMEELNKQGCSLYAVIAAASKRARTVNDWRLQRARVLYEEYHGPKATVQALDEIADKTVRVVLPETKDAE
jgi:DNA-directed RNA polymerase subunit K/omega